jgi:hypothetical protein
LSAPYIFPLLVLPLKQHLRQNVSFPQNIALRRQHKKHPATEKTSISEFCVPKNEKTVCTDLGFVLPGRIVLFGSSRSQYKSKIKKNRPNQIFNKKCWRWWHWAGECQKIKRAG